MAEELTDDEYSHEGYRWGRILNRSVAQVSEDHYEVRMEISFPAARPPVVPVGEGSFYGAQDNLWEVYVNGTPLSIPGDHAAPDRDERIEIPDGLLVSGTNVIAAKITNGHEPIGWTFGNPTAWLVRAYLGLDDSTAAIANTSTATKVWQVSNNDTGTIGGEPTGWETVGFDDSGWDAAADVGEADYFFTVALNEAYPPTAPAVWIAPAAAVGGTHARDLIWLGRITFEL